MATCVGHGTAMRISNTFLKESRTTQLIQATVMQRSSCETDEVNVVNAMALRTRSDPDVNPVTGAELGEEGGMALDDTQ